jgi:small nuclear ribonucleoprotein (snRNP)-like protein
LVKSFLENAFDRQVPAILKEKRTLAGCIKSFSAVSFTKPKDLLRLA